MTSLDGPMFVGLNHPHKGLISAAVANVLNKAIELVQGIQLSALDPLELLQQLSVNDFVRAVEHWKSLGTYEQHYVHSRTPSSFMGNIFYNS